MEQGRRLQMSSADSKGVRKKLLAKSNLFKRRRRTQNGPEQKSKSQGGQEAFRRRSMNDKELEIKTILFVEQSPNGELAGRLRERIGRMEHTRGFRGKVVERTGR